MYKNKSSGLISTTMWVFVVLCQFSVFVCLFFEEVKWGLDKVLFLGILITLYIRNYLLCLHVGLNFGSYLPDHLDFSFSNVGSQDKLSE